MPVSAEFGFNWSGNTVPYPPLWKGIRTNAGFVDLRGKPDLVAEIHEARNSPGLTALLRMIAVRSDWHSVGCDLGEKIDDAAVGRKMRAGGYVQLICSDFALDADAFEALGRKILESLQQSAGADDDWHLDFVIRPVALRIDVANDEFHSLWIWFDCYAAAIEAAKVSRERLLEAMSSFFALKDANV